MENRTEGCVIIIGAGLTGLTLGYFLEKRNINFILLESRPRLGGRIYTELSQEDLPIEMGATWLGNKHSNLSTLLKELGLGVFKQELGNKAIFEPISTSPPYLASLPFNDDPSLRIKGGSSTLINALSETINADRIHLNERVISITLHSDCLQVASNSSTYQATKVISTLPPNLLVNTISFSPSLPSSLLSIANTTHTWMGESIKVALSFDTPFWRKLNKSATIMSNVGPIQEMYEHNNVEDNGYALVGFMNNSYYLLSREERLNKILIQLTKYYGGEVKNYREYHEKTWRTDNFTYYPYNSHVMPHQHNGHVIYRQSYLDDRLIVGGTETSPVFPGYMDGAVYSAIQAMNTILTKKS